MHTSIWWLFNRSSGGISTSSAITGLGVCHVVFPFNIEIEGPYIFSVISTVGEWKIMGKREDQFEERFSEAHERSEQDRCIWEWKSNDKKWRWNH